MRVRSLYEVIQQAQDLCAHFDGVETNEQMISRLERLKRAPGGPESLLDSIEATKLAIEDALSDTLEIGASTSIDDLSLDPDLETELGLEEQPIGDQDPGEQISETPTAVLSPLPTPRQDT